MSPSSGLRPSKHDATTCHQVTYGQRRSRSRAGPTVVANPMRSYGARRNSRTRRLQYSRRICSLPFFAGNVAGLRDANPLEADSRQRSPQTIAI